jgi:RNA polymerase sigma-70 factor, ECF subfamily
MKKRQLEEFPFLKKDELIISLMEKYGDIVKRLAFSYVKDESLAEDITQDVFLKCYMNIDSFKGASSYKTWIYRITINCSKDMVKSKFFSSVISINKIKNPFKKYITSTESEIIQKEINNRIAECVLSLPVKYREIIFLYYFGDLKIQEINHITNINIETIKSRLKRGKAILKEKLNMEDLYYE